MTIVTVELNDSEIRVARGNQVILRSAGVAVVNREGLHVGDEALKLAYLNPRETHDRHWYKLNQDALHAPARDYRHHADLVYAHLLTLYEQAGKPGELIFTVPGSYSDQQLSMLLGIVAACPFNAVGLVDTAVAGSAMIASTGPCQFLDMHLHQCVITQLEAGSSVTRTGVITIDDIGFVKLYSLVAGLVADLFIQQSRFDPQHHAETEQLLYDQLPGALMTLMAAREVDLEIHYQNTTHHARLSRDALLNKLQPIYDRLHERLVKDRATILADRMLKLPGFSERLPGFLPSTAETLFESCQKHMLEIITQGPELRFVTSLPAEQQARTEARGNSNTVLALDAGVTHIASSGRAFPLSDGRLYLSVNGNISTVPDPGGRMATIDVNAGNATLIPGKGNNLLINGIPATNGIILQPGDKVQAGNAGIQYEFMQVMTGNDT